MSSAYQSGEIVPLFASDAIAGRVRELARSISNDYQDKQPILVCVLNGAWVFMADLIRQLDIPVRCDFVKLTSYGTGSATSGTVKLHLDLVTAIQDRDVVLVEDIIDTGTTITRLLEHLQAKQPRSIRLCALLDKPARRQTPLIIDYLGFTIPNQFVIGYGLDYAEQYRHLPYIGYLASPSGPKS